MAILSIPWDVRALWAALTLTMKLYVLFLFGVVIWTLVALIRGRLARQTRDLHYLALLLFGVCLSNECFAAMRAIKFSMASLSPVGIEAFEPAVAVSFVVFAVLTCLHVLSWLFTPRS